MYGVLQCWETQMFFQLFRSLKFLVDGKFSSYFISNSYVSSVYNNPQDTFGLMKNLSKVVLRFFLSNFVFEIHILLLHWRDYKPLAHGPGSPV